MTHPPRPSLRVAGHFGELMQGRIGAGGPVALISLPCPDLFVQASVSPMPRPALALHCPGQPRPILQPSAARRLLAQLGLALPGRVVMAAHMPVGAGAGASTAALVALARLAGWQGAPLELARACVAIEGASDPLMLPRPAQQLWASRLGHILQPLPALPDFDILGGFWGPARPTDPHDHDFPDIAPLLADWTAAARARDLAALAALASRSALQTLARRGPWDDPTPALAAEMGAKGFLIAHTGAARGLIFAPGQVPRGAVDRLRALGLKRVMIFGYRGG